MRLHRKNINGPVTIEQIQEFQNRFSLKISEEYVDFLLEYNGTQIEEGYFTLENGRKLQVRQLYGYYKRPGASSLIQYHWKSFIDFSEKYLPIGDDGRKRFALNVGDNEENGSIWFKDMDFRSELAPPDSCLIKVANNFLDFWNGIV